MNAFPAGAAGVISRPAKSTALAALWFLVAGVAALAGAGIFVLSTATTDVEPPARPATQVRQLSCEPLADMPGKSVTTARVVFPPLAHTPAHRHPGSVTAYVVSGSIRSQMEATPARTYLGGSTWFEPAGAVHLFAENTSATQTAELLAVFITDGDCGPLVIPEPHGSTHKEG